MIRAEAVWLDGRMVPFAEAQVHVSCFGLHYGMAVFEGIRSYRQARGGSAVFRLREHVARLLYSARVAAIAVPYDAAALEAACLETLRANRLDEAYLRPIAYVGAGALGLGATSNATQVSVLAFPFAPVLGEEGLRNGVRAHVSSFVRGHLGHTMSKAKITGGYVTSVLAKRESQRLGLDEAILLDGGGRVCEGTGVNLFAVLDGVLCTPSAELPILPGITRDSVLRLASDAGVPTAERVFGRDALYAADELFLTGTAAEVTPIREIDGRPVGEGRPGPITRRLQQAFYDAARGGRPAWLTPL